MGMKAPSRTMIAASLLFALTAFSMTLFVWTQFGGSLPLRASGYAVNVSLPNAPNLAANADVRIAGVTIGKVAAVDSRGERADARLEIDAEHVPLPRDVRAVLRSKTLLGEAFIELSPGRRTAGGIPDGGRIPNAQVAQTESIDLVLGAFDPPTRKAFKDFLGELADAVGDSGAALNATIANAGQGLPELERVVAVLDAQREGVSTLVADSGEALRGLGARDEELRELVRAGSEVLSATASRRAELTATTRALPGFLAALRRTVEKADAVVAEAGPTLRTLRPAARNVRPALAQAVVLAPQVERLFEELRPVVAASRRGLPAAERLIKALGPLSAGLDAVGRELIPVLEYVAAYRREVIATFANLAAATQATAEQPDGSRLHYLRALIPLGNESYYGASERLPSNRFNPYMAPGALEGLANGQGLRAFDCAHTGNPQTLPVLGTGSPPCVVQEPWEFKGRRRSYQHVERGPRP